MMFLYFGRERKETSLAKMFTQLLDKQTQDVISSLFSF